MTKDDDQEFKIIRELKENAKVVWSDFSLFEHFTGTAAPKVVKFAGINANDRVLDVGCGTGTFISLAPDRISGVDLNIENVKYCQNRGYKVVMCPSLYSLSRATERNGCLIPAVPLSLLA